VSSTATVLAPAKLTLSLRVTGVRPDGHHLLESEMVTLDLADTLAIEESADGQIAPNTGAGGVLSIDPHPDGPWTNRGPDPIPLGPENLVNRALVALDRTASVRIVKRVPPGAGLGGGSADAAAILRWAGCSDLELAAKLGADVPFCVTGGRAMVGGVGEVVAPLPYEERRFTLLLVPFGVDTAAVYRAWDRLAAEGGPTAPNESTNDLEAAALMVEPRLGRWKEYLERLAGRQAHLAGSGSTWFVEGSTEELGLTDGHSLSAGDQSDDGGGGGATTQAGQESAVLVSVLTTPPMV
jgi:4-diphosphocytidyl-2-C-methyl-D-erythritol kinase